MIILRLEVDNILGIQDVEYCLKDIDLVPRASQSLDKVKILLSNILSNMLPKDVEKPMKINIISISESLDEIFGYELMKRFDREYCDIERGYINEKQMFPKERVYSHGRSRPNGHNKGINISAYYMLGRGCSNLDERLYTEKFIKFIDEETKFIESENHEITEEKIISILSSNSNYGNETINKAYINNEDYIKYKDVEGFVGMELSEFRKIYNSQEDIRGWSYVFDKKTGETVNEIATSMLKLPEQNDKNYFILWHSVT